MNGTADNNSRHGPCLTSAHEKLPFAVRVREFGVNGEMLSLSELPGMAENVKRAGLADIVTVVPGDAFANLPATPGSFDFVFLDAWKKDYKRFLDLMLPRMNKGGLFVAHNVVNKRSEMGDFLDAIWTTPALWTTIVSPSSEGMSVSVKK